LYAPVDHVDELAGHEVDPHVYRSTDPWMSGAFPAESTGVHEDAGGETSGPTETRFARRDYSRP
jgi:hypothetical protein